MTNFTVGFANGNYCKCSAINKTNLNNTKTAKSQWKLFKHDKVLFLIKRNNVHRHVFHVLFNRDWTHIWWTWGLDNHTCKATVTNKKKCKCNLTTLNNMPIYIIRKDYTSLMLVCNDQFHLALAGTLADTLNVHLQVAGLSPASDCKVINIYNSSPPRASVKFLSSLMPGGKRWGWKPRFCQE